MATEELSLGFYGVNPLASDVNLNEGLDSTKIIDNLNLNFRKSVSSDADFEALQKRHADGSDDLFETEVEDLDSDADMDTSSSSSSFLPSSQNSQDSSQEAWSKTLANLAETQLPFNPKPKTPKKSGSNSEKLNLIIGLLNGKLLPQQAAAEKQTNSLIANQKHISLKINELSNEIQRSKLFTKCKINELVKDNIDREYERCNLVVYNLDIGNWHHYLKIYKNPKKAVFQLGLKFVNTFMAYDSRDLSVSKLVQNPGGENNKENKTKDNKHFRILLKLATPDDALRLKKRCFKRGFFTLRNGLTRKEREACAIIQQRVDSWNQKLNDKSETMFVRKFLFNIAEVDRSDSKKVIKWHESLESAEKYFESKITALAMIPIEMTKKTESLPDLAQKIPEGTSESVPQKNLRNELLPNLNTPGTRKPMSRTASLPSSSPPRSKTASLPSSSPPRFLDPAIVESSTIPKKPNPKHKANLESTLSLSFSGVKRKATSPSHPLSPNGHPPSKRGRGRPALSAAQKKINSERNKKRREAIKLAKAEAEKLQQEELAKKQKEAEEAIQLMKEMRDEVSRLRAENKAKDNNATA